MTLQRANLVDLAKFGIHIHNPEHHCCICGANTRGWSEGLLADDLCRNCSTVGPRGERRSRHEALFYTAKTIHVRPPQVRRSRNVYVVNNVVQPQRVTSRMLCVVKIDNELFAGRDRGNYVALYNTAGTLIREFGLEITQQLLATIYAQQRS
jgi:hypothetical protein